MSRARWLLPILLLWGIGCDTASIEEDDTIQTVRYRTDRSDWARTVVQLPDGWLLVGGYTDGVGAPTDGTLAVPLLLWIDINGTIRGTAVYRDLRHGEVVGIAPLGEDLAVLVYYNPYEHGGGPTRTLLYRARSDGSRKEVLYEAEGGAASRHALLTLPNGGLVMAVERSLVRLELNGAPSWKRTFDALAFIADLAIDDRGRIYGMGPLKEGEGIGLFCVTSGGALEWERTYVPDELMRFYLLTLTPDSLVVGGRRFQDPRIVLLFFDREGNKARVQFIGEGSIRLNALRTLPERNEIVVGLIEQYRPPAEGPGFYSSYLVLIDSTGTERARWLFGPERGSTFVEDLLVAGNRLIAVGATGPERLSGHGGDDFDVLVQIRPLYDAQKTRA
ncbi:hypothetical protein [Rhodothermus profundi]|uniref:Uncharacterized protein n=1 Tax=Rhodothermus profundi TaxID=633813 RepID=A0A1M6X9V9_9BACT|nr:hypothetical protein [Rhodothermus profundi]SHL02659.1 hypothetical protein SAMN04488087_2558 [Rhodothermus profundi]